jgi:hypothetical protein
LYDPSRRPPDWTAVVRPGQYVAFSKTCDSGASCDAGGQPFASPAAATCLLFDDLTKAQAFCREQVLRAPAVRFEIFDSTGRSNPSLLVVVHPSRVPALDGNPRGMRARTVAAAALAAGSVPLFWYDYTREGLVILPTIVAMNMLLVAARLIQLNSSYAHAERERRQRLAAHTGNPPMSEDSRVTPGLPRDAGRDL